MNIAQAYDRLARAVRDLRAGGWNVTGTATIAPHQIPGPDPGPAPIPVPGEPPPGPPPLAASAVHGSPCQTCGNVELMRAGGCEVCLTCGSTTSCG